jgi:DNA-binding winged helix-turn-helix (wHTH) protein
VRRLRGKLEENPSNPRLIITKPGIGYSLSRMGAGSRLDETSDGAN